jgi:hypothetical protein
MAFQAMRVFDALDDEKESKEDRQRSAGDTTTSDIIVSACTLCSVCVRCPAHLLLSAATCAELELDQAAKYGATILHTRLLTVRTHLVLCGSSGGEKGH